MMNKVSIGSLLAFAVVFLTSCELIGGVFKVGMWVGVILVILVVAIVLWLLRKIRR